MSAPFKVYRRGGRWWLQGRHWPQSAIRRPFSTPGDAIDYAYRNWPWWP